MLRINGKGRFFLRFFLSCFFLFWSIFISLSVSAGDASYGALSPADRRSSLAPYTDLRFPNNKGTYPLAIILPGCMGWHPHHTKWRKELLKQKFAVLHVDSFAARGLDNPSVLRKEVCTGKIATGDERAGDMVAVIPEIWDNPRIQPDKTLLMGWSHGGWTALDLLVSLESRIKLPNLTHLPGVEVENIKAAVLYYPWCGSGALNWSGNLPTDIRGYVFHGSRDTITSPRECKRRVQRSSKNGGQLEFVELKGAFHWFDNYTAEFFDKRSYSIAFSKTADLVKMLKEGSFNYRENDLKSGSSLESDDLIDLFDGINDP